MHPSVGFQKIIVVMLCVYALGFTFATYSMIKKANADVDHSIDEIIERTNETLERAKENNRSSSRSTLSDLESEVTSNNQEKMEQTTVTLQTNKGDITIELFKESTPKTVENFLKLSKDGYYNDTKFHRIIDGFMIQGGDPLSKDDTMKSRWGTGGPGYTFEDEFVADLSNLTGTISMANAGPNTNGSQFFINVADNTFLDGKHSVFGKVVEGMGVVESLSRVDTDPTDKPLEAVVISSVVVSE